MRSHRRVVSDGVFEVERLDVGLAEPELVILVEPRLYLVIEVGRVAHHRHPGEAPRRSHVLTNAEAV